MAKTRMPTLEDHIYFGRALTIARDYTLKMSCKYNKTSEQRKRLKKLEKCLDDIKTDMEDYLYRQFPEADRNNNMYEGVLLLQVYYPHKLDLP